MSSCQCNQIYDFQPKIRCTPTYFHHPIFEDFGTFREFYHTCSKSQCIPSQQPAPYTYCMKNKTNSTLQNTLKKTQNGNTKQQSDNLNSQYQKRTQQKVRPHSSGRYPQLQKQISFNPNSSTKFENAGNFNPVSNHTLLWFDPEKSLLLRQSAACNYHGYSRQRKLLQLSSCPLYPAGGNAYRAQDAGWNRANAYSCYGVARQSQICTCGACKKHGCVPQTKQNIKVQEKAKCCQNGQCKCSSNCQCGAECGCCDKNNKKKFSNCQNCSKSCPCDKKCACTDNCQCYEQKVKKQAVAKKIESACACGKGKCKCDNECSCGINCKCCPKFKPYSTENQLSKQQNRINEQQILAKTCKCGPECSCLPGCKCGPQCNCGDMKKRYNEQINKNTQNTNIPNGTKKSKIPSGAVRKSQPVFRSVTARRR